MKTNLLTTIYKIQNRLRTPVLKLIEEKRRSNYPFLSCDTYALMSDVYFSNRIELSNLARISDANTIYAEVSKVDELLEKLKVLRKKPRLEAVYLGDSDVPASDTNLNALLEFTEKVYCVNLPKNLGPRIFALPLGLENKSYGGGGLTSHYRRKVVYEVSLRPLSVLIAWNDETNNRERTHARIQLRESPLVYEVNKRVPFQALGKLIRKSLLIPCPIGNGIDTHRFWEAIYLGALPVVRERDELFFEFRVPRFVISNWSDLSNLSRLDIEEIYGKHKAELTNFKLNTTRYLDQSFNRK